LDLYANHSVFITERIKRIQPNTKQVYRNRYIYATYFGLYLGNHEPRASVEVQHSSFLTSAIDRDELSPSRYCRLTRGKARTVRAKQEFC
jgi:hypothetical protein